MNRRKGSQHIGLGVSSEVQPSEENGTERELKDVNSGDEEINSSGSNLNIASAEPALNHKRSSRTLSNFSKILLSKKHSEEDGSAVSPSTVQRLINDTRTRLGLPEMRSPEDPADEPPPSQVPSLALENDSTKERTVLTEVNDETAACIENIKAQVEHAFVETLKKLDDSNEENLEPVDKLSSRKSDNHDKPTASATKYPSGVIVIPSVCVNSGGSEKNNSGLILSKKRNHNIASPFKSPKKTNYHSSKTLSVTTPFKYFQKSRTPVSISKKTKTKDSVASCSKQEKDSNSKKHGSSKWKFSSETIKNNEYLILHKLGEGGCGTVNLAFHKQDRQLYAIKKIDLTSVTDFTLEECINEVKMLVDLKDSDLVIRIHAWEICRSENRMKIAMEYGTQDLSKSLKSGIKTIVSLKYIWERMLLIIDSLHSRGIVHSDLKPANFVWVGELLKIIDFGISSRLQNGRTSITMLAPKGTLNFVSPEIITQDTSGKAKLSPKSDIWSLACILYMMVYGRSPFEDISNSAAKMAAIMNASINYPELPEKFKKFDIIPILKSCFKLNYKERPTARELLHHPFLTGI